MPPCLWPPCNSLMTRVAASAAAAGLACRHRHDRGNFALTTRSRADRIAAGAQLASLFLLVIESLVKAQPRAGLREVQAPAPAAAHGQFDDAVAIELGAGNVGGGNAAVAAGPGRHRPIRQHIAARTHRHPPPSLAIKALGFDRRCWPRLGCRRGRCQRERCPDGHHTRPKCRQSCLIPVAAIPPEAAPATLPASLPRCAALLEPWLNINCKRRVQLLRKSR